MRKFEIISVLLLMSCSTQVHENSQGSDELVVFPFGKESFEWTSIEQSVDKKEKIRFAETRPWLEAMYGDTYKDNVHAFDLNGDQQLDFIYSGPGPVNDYTIIALGNGGDDLTFDGTIVDLKVRDRKNCRLYLSSLAQTAAPEVERQTILDISFEGNKPTVRTIFRNETIQGTKLPNAGTYYEIEVVSDTLIARAAPIELDTPYHQVIDMEGNRLGLLTMGSKGTVVGEYTDSLKAVWMCVLVDPQYRIIGYPYPYGGRRFNPKDSTTRMVWIRKQTGRPN
jgi:hypothetical protein